MAYVSCLGINPIHYCCIFTMIMLVLFTLFISISITSIYWIFYLLGQIQDYKNYYLSTFLVFVRMFNLSAKFPIFFLLLNLFSFYLLFLQCLSKFVALLYYCSMFLEDYSNSISFCIITSFISLLNSSIKDLPL